MVRLFFFFGLFFLGSGSNTLFAHDYSENPTAFNDLLLKGKKIFVPSQVKERKDSVHSFLSTDSTHVVFDADLMPELAGTGLEKAAFEYVDSQKDILGFSSEDLAPTIHARTNVSESIVELNFKRSFESIPVRDSLVTFSFQKKAERYRLREFKNRSYGQINLSNPEAEESSFGDLSQALGISSLKLIAKTRHILPLNDGTFPLVTEFKVEDTAIGEEYTVSLRDGDLEVVEAFPRKVSSTVVKANVYKRNYLETAFTPKAVPLTTVIVNGQTLTTDADGLLASETLGNAQISLNSSRVRLVNSGSATPISFNAPLNTSPMNLLAPLANDLTAFNAYLAIHEINRQVRRYLKPSEANLLGRNITVNLNVAGSCNAFYDGNISLFSAGQGCANMGLVNDVIYHEWGHGLDDDTGPSGGIADGAFSEGLSDVVAGYFSNSSNMAPGFQQGSATGIRQLKNTKRFPNDQGEVHAEGEIIGGAFWDLREALIARHGKVKGAYLSDLFFYRHLLMADTYAQSYQSVLSLDDTDGNPATPSPNRCLISKAFKNHGLSTDADCTDPASADNVTVNDSIFLGVKTQDASGVVLMAAIDKASSVELCLGERQPCLQTGAGTIAFDFDGANDSGKLFFVAKSPFSIKDHAVVTVLAKDQSGQISSARSLKFATK